MIVSEQYNAITVQNFGLTSASHQCNPLTKPVSLTPRF